MSLEGRPFVGNGVPCNMFVERWAGPGKLNCLKWMGAMFSFLILIQLAGQLKGLPSHAFCSGTRLSLKESSKGAAN